MKPPKKGVMIRTKKAPSTGYDKYIICRKCGTKNPVSTKTCINCGHEKFHPDWVKEHVSINKAVSVDITTSNPKEGEKKDRISLNKFFPSIKPQNFNISSPEHWEKIKAIIDNDLAPKLGWQAKEDLLIVVEEELVKNKNRGKGKDEGSRITDLIEQYPQFSADFLDKISETLKNSDFEKVQLLLEHIAAATSSFDEVFFGSLKQVFEKLKGEDKVSIITFGELLKEWNLKQITDVTKEVKRRLAEIQLFVEKIEDEKTYEIKGDNSIHRILERSMWLIDDKYWIVQSNKQLRTFIGNELAKEDKKFEKDRPDFACGSYDNLIIIIEIKRPSHTLTIADLDQLVKYMIISRKYLSNRKNNFKAILVGNAKSKDLEAKMEFTQKVELLTYNDLVQDCKQRYSDFLKHVSENKL